MRKTVLRALCEEARANVSKANNRYMERIKDNKKVLLFIKGNAIVKLTIDSF